ncbi:uncharacterized protein [Palaemon carinicauda]|uniref:uncharacterized protein n=1 Tax=Palaemon carinicauda TaxID=392227 RepID=UPI0035B600F6
MVSCKLVVLAMVVGTVMSASYPHHLRPRSAPSSTPVSVCHNWCGTPPNYHCCDRECPVDDRPIFECNRLSTSQDSRISGPERCQSDSECSGNAICCWDSCLAHKKCTNV